MLRRYLKIWVFFAGLVVCAAGLAWATWPASKTPPKWDYSTASPDSKEEDLDFPYELTARQPEEIAAGTVIERSAPPGWSHLIIKSYPRVREDQKAGLLAVTIEKASWMFTAFLADVRPESEMHGTRFRLNRVGLGMGASMLGRDTILAPEKDKPMSDQISWLNRIILTKGYEVQRKALLVVRGPTFALLDTPVWFRLGDSNQLLRYRYAMVVSGHNGHLDSLVWVLEAVGGDRDDLNHAVLLNPDTIETADLLVDRKRVNPVGLPADDAFSVGDLPVGRAKLHIPPELRPLATQTKFTSVEAHALETGLRQLISSQSR